VLTTVAVVAAGASASPAAAGPPPPATTAVTGAVATAPAADEPRVTVTGTLRRVAVAAPDGARSTVAAVVTADGDAVQVRTQDVTGVAGGAQVEVTVPASATDTATLDLGGGAEVMDVEVVDAGTGAAAVKAAAVARDVHLMSATLPGTVMDPSVDLAVTSAAIADASDYFSLSTRGRISFALASQQDAGAFADWGDPGSCTTDQIFTFFDWAADQAGVFPANGSGSHVVVQTPLYSPCEIFGLMADVDDGGTVWVNGLQGAGDQLDPWLLTQALGHTLGLGFSDTRYGCAGLPDGSYDDCRDGFLGSAYDVMGLVIPQSGDLAGAPGLLNAAQLDVLGLLTSDDTVFASSAYTATLNPVGSTSGWRYLVVQTDVARYYVEFRGTAGLDADLGSTRLGCPQGIADCVPTVYQPGVLVYRVDDYPWLGSDTYLVEANATHPAYRTPASTFTLDPGRTLVTEDGVLSLRRAVSSPAGTATVSVADGPGSAVHLPSGNFESVSSSPGKVRLRGWAIDRDTRLSSYLSVTVAGRGQLARATAGRPDIASFFPEQGVNHGFDVTFDAPAGAVTVCVTVVNTGPGTNTSLGCRSTTVPAGGSPVGVLESVKVAPGAVTFTGWALDPDTAASSYVYVSAGTQSQYAVANQARPDVAKFFPAYGPAHGFSTTLTALPGTQTVCATAVNHGSGTHTSLGCRTVTVPTASPIGNLDEMIVLSGRVLHFSGWAIDPDVPGPVTIWIDVDGQGVRILAANEWRPDIARVFPEAGYEHGFSGGAILPAGSKKVCIWAVNNARGTNTNMGCRQVWG
jgi:hypothetical protein